MLMNENESSHVAMWWVVVMMMMNMTMIGTRTTKTLLWGHEANT